MSTQQHHRHHHHHPPVSGTQNIQAKTENDNSIRLRAYEIYCEKGGGALENWLEAEQTVKNNH